MNGWFSKYLIPKKINKYTESYRNQLLPSSDRVKVIF